MKILILLHERVPIFLKVLLQIHKGPGELVVCQSKPGQTSGKNKCHVILGSMNAYMMDLVFSHIQLSMEYEKVSGMDISYFDISLWDISCGVRSNLQGRTFSDREKKMLILSKYIVLVVK